MHAIATNAVANLATLSKDNGDDSSSGRPTNLSERHARQTNGTAVKAMPPSGSMTIGAAVGEKIVRIARFRTNIAALVRSNAARGSCASSQSQRHQITQRRPLYY